MPNRSFDSLIKEIVHKQIDSIVPPSKEEVWEQIKQKLSDERRKKQYRRLKSILIACTVIVVLTVTFVYFYTPVMAFTGRIIKSIEEVTENSFIVRKIVSFNPDSQENAITNDKYDDPRIDEAKRNISFEILLPKYVPEDYELYSVNVFNKDKEREKVTLLYINIKDENKKESFEIEEQSYPDDSESEMKYVMDPDTKVEYLEINEVKCTLLSYDKMHNILFWDNNNISYKIDGNISKDDIVKIVKTMK